MTNFTYLLLLATGVLGFGPALIVRQDDTSIVGDIKDLFKGLNFTDAQLDELANCYTQCATDIAPTLRPVLVDCLDGKRIVDLSVLKCACSNEDKFVKPTKSCDDKCFPADRISDFPSQADVEQVCAKALQQADPGEDSSSSGTNISTQKASDTTSGATGDQTNTPNPPQSSPENSSAHSVASVLSVSLTAFSFSAVLSL